MPSLTGVQGALCSKLSRRLLRLGPYPFFCVDGFQRLESSAGEASQHWTLITLPSSGTASSLSRESPFPRSRAPTSAARGSRAPPLSERSRG